MNKTIFLILCFLPTVLFAQLDIKRLTEMQKIFFVSEAVDLASSTYNPAAIISSPEDGGVVLGYDFDDLKIQGNSSLFFLSKNIGFSYQDVYNLNEFRLQNYAVNLSIGNEYLSIGTINRYTKVTYNNHELDVLSFDAGVIFNPSEFISFGLLARNLGQTGFDSLLYARNYTAGIGLSFFNDSFRIYADADFVDYSKIKDLKGSIGFVFALLNLFEFRSGVVLNPEDIAEIRTQNVKLIDLKYEAFASISFLVKNSIRVTLATRFNDLGERTRISTIVGFPLSVRRN